MSAEATAHGLYDVADRFRTNSHRRVRPDAAPAKMPFLEVRAATASWIYPGSRQTGVGTAQEIGIAARHPNPVTTRSQQMRNWALMEATLCWSEE